ncbi:MAG: WYL domain-containing protein [Deltaproteobacteria bacterium]|nr:WYL domain-containing protein [Deltaproteobacteria bacterium]
MNRTQRLLELVYFLMAGARPVTLGELRETFPDYQAENEESSRRKFERDKDTLRQLGIAVEVVRDEETESSAYRIDAEESFLPPIDLEEDEVLALALLSRVARQIDHFPLARQTDEALRKILYDRQVDPEEGAAGAPFVRMPDEASNPEQREWLARIYDGIERRKTLRCRYHTLHSDRVADRAINPYGLVYRSGHWSVIGWCHLRKAERTFLVERFRDVQVNPRNASRPDFELPQDFDLRGHRVPPPWLWDGGAARAVQIDFTPTVAWQIEKSHEGLGKFESLPGGGGRLTVSASNPEALVDWVLAFGPEAVIVKPASLVRSLTGRVRGALALHAGEDAR